MIGSTLMSLVLRVATDEDGRRQILSVQGEIDIATVDELAAELASLGDGEELILDLTETDFMDSSGLRLIIETNERLTTLGRRFKLAVSSGPISRLLDATGTRDQLDVHDTLEGAAAG
jgi:anti-anti-sigma factor